MKQYLWVAAVVAMVGANASENPFDLNANLKKIDQAEQQLLGDLEKIAKEKEAKEDLELNMDEKGGDEKAAAPVEKTEVVEVPSKPVISIETAEEKEARLKKAKEEQVRLEAERAAAEKAAAAKAAKEAAELERIRKAQAEKKAAEEKKAADELAELKAEKAAMEKKLAKESKAKKSIEKSKSSAPKSVEDVNIAQEFEAAAKAAQKSLEEAIREVDQD